MNLLNIFEIMDYLDPKKDPEGYDKLRKTVESIVKQTELHTKPSNKTNNLFKKMEDRIQNLEKKTNDVVVNLAVLTNSFKTLNDNISCLTNKIDKLVDNKADVKIIENLKKEIASNEVEIKNINDFNSKIKGGLIVMNILWALALVLLGIFLQ